LVQGDNNQPGGSESDWQPSRLKLARELRGLTRAQLAVALDKSAAAVGQYEAAKIQPQRRAWRTLATALSLQPAFFRLPTPGVANQFFFRPDRTVPQTAYRRSAAIATLLGELHAQLSPPVAEPQSARGTRAARPDIPRLRLSIGNAAEFELVAEGIRAAWGLGNNPIENLTTVMEERRIVVAPVNDNPAPTGSYSTWIGTTPWIFTAASAGLPSQARFDAAHELGHLILHTSQDIDSPKAEREAESFALAFLMPRRGFELMSPRITDIALAFLKRVWGVPMAALVRRAYDLEIITEASFRRAHARLNRDSYRRTEPFEPPAEIPKALASLVASASEAGTLDAALNAVAWPKSLLYELVT
jgi:Zn-dependent peptidase ImmA (M78 family)/transcriptional regulator with XRE-family HTH domain